MLANGLCLFKYSDYRLYYTNMQVAVHCWDVLL